jgi:hypothetical protein
MMKIAYKQVAIAGGLGIIFGWFFAKKLSTLAYEMHLPRPDWLAEGHVGSGFSQPPPGESEDELYGASDPLVRYCLTNPYDQDCIAMARIN